MLRAVDIDDAVIEYARLEREAMRYPSRRMADHQGEAFKDLPVCDPQSIPTVPEDKP